MAGVLRQAGGGRHRVVLPAGWWLVDFIMAPYLAAIGLLVGLYFRRVPEAPALIAAHVAGLALIAWAASAHPAPGTSASRIASAFRHWYPIAYIPLCYKEMAILIPAIRAGDMDARVAHFDYRIWGAHATVWLERFYHPWLTELLQIIYTLFLPVVVFIAVAIWLRCDREQFRYYAVLITVGFLASYIGYLLVPVRGPRYFLAHLHHSDLKGLWLFEHLQQTLDRLESAHYDCFPSGHTEMTVIAWWSSRMISKKLFAVLAVYVILIVFATVYLRYHYTIDVFAGAALAALLLALVPKLYAAALARKSG